MAVDASMRTLKIPPKFMPYLDKHRIYELFHDLGNKLALFQPEDHLVFLRDCLKRSEIVRETRLIFLLTPPYIDNIELAHLLSVRTGCGILSRYIACLKAGDFTDAHALAENTADMITGSDTDGWILADYPKTFEEAKALIEHKVIPTHVFLVLPEEQESAALSCYPEDEKQPRRKEHLHALDTTPSILLEFDDSLHRLQKLFSSSLKTIKTNDKDLEEIANACARLTMKWPHWHAPKLFRVVLIGPRGSRRRTVAKILNRKFNLVIVDMENLINICRITENELGDEMRYLDKNNILYPTRIVFNLLKSRLSKQDCLERGYVLINYPTCIEDFVLLDSIDTPPNKVIFLDIEGSECQERLEDRVVNEYTGKLYSKKITSNDTLLKSQKMTHPDDEDCKVAEEIKFYNKRVKAMRDYCGGTSFTVEARGPITALVERIEAVLMGPSPTTEPRSGKLPPRRTSKESLIKTKSSISTTSTKMSFPVSRTDILPLLDSDFLRRYQDLKRDVTPRDRTGKVIPSDISEEKLLHANNGNEDLSLEPKNAVNEGMSDVLPEVDSHGDGVHTIMSPKAHSVSSSWLAIKH